jgi:hypothetical protein
VSFQIFSRAGLLIMLVATSARAADQDITVSAPSQGVCPVNTDLTFKAKPGDAVNEAIGVNGAGSQVEWSFAATEGMCASATATTVTCAGSLTITIPSGTVDESAKATLIGKPTAGDLLKAGAVTLKVTAANGKCGTRRYPISVTSTGGGWGDPHMTTVDGVHYDFQSAGEFTALREDKFEVQTRQRPVPTTTVPGPSEYTGLRVCVSIYSAVAARVGSNRVTLEPT